MSAPTVGSAPTTTGHHPPMWHCRTEDAGPVDRDDYRRLMSAFPTGVAVITAVGQYGRLHGLTCTSLTSVTLQPPTLLVCLGLRSGTLAAVRHGGYFAVNLLHTRGRRAAEVFSSPTPDRFSQVRWRPSRWTGQPWLAEDAFAMAECVVVDASVVGDHAVVFGKVVHVEQAADLPLLYGLRRFSGWPGDPVADPPPAAIPAPAAPTGVVPAAAVPAAAVPAAAVPAAAAAAVPAGEVPAGGRCG